MQHPALAVRRCGVYIRNTAIHIPLDIFHISLIQNCTNLIVNAIYYFFSGEIEHELMSGTVRTASRDYKSPVRMLTVELAVLVDHLRLDPDTEFQSHAVDVLDQFSKRTSKFFFVYFPVSKSSQVAVTVTEPAVVHYEHLDAELRRLRRQFEKRLSCKIKIRSFPAV